MPSWTASRPAVTGPDGALDDLLVVHLDSIQKRLLEHLDQDDRVHGLRLPSQGDGGRAPSTAPFVSIGPGHQALERSLEMVTSACDGRYCLDRCHNAADRWLLAPEA
jgi:hypothetical protein